MRAACTPAAWQSQENNQRLVAITWAAGIGTAIKTPAANEQGSTRTVLDVGVSRSAISRKAIDASVEQPRALQERCWENIEILIRYIDGQRFADHHIIADKYLFVLAEVQDIGPPLQALKNFWRTPRAAGLVFSGSLIRLSSALNYNRS